MRIKRVLVDHVNQSIWGHLAEREKTLPLVTPLDVYAEYKTTRSSWFWESGTAIVRIEADDGTIGTGWCEDGCGAIAPVSDRHLANLLIGQNPLETEGLWDSWNSRHTRFPAPLVSCYNGRGCGGVEMYSDRVVNGG